MGKSLNEIIEDLKEARDNAVCDLRGAEWLENSDRRVFEINLKLLNEAIVSLETIVLFDNEQFYSSVISK